MAEVAAELRERLGRSTPVPEAGAGRDRPDAGRRYTHTSAKARTTLGWDPRPTTTTVVECAESLLAHGVI